MSGWRRQGKHVGGICQFRLSVGSSQGKFRPLLLVFTLRSRLRYAKAFPARKAFCVHGVERYVIDLSISLLSFPGGGARQGRACLVGAVPELPAQLLRSWWRGQRYEGALEFGGVGIAQQ